MKLFNICIPGNEPSSVIQKSGFKNKNEGQKVPKEAEAKRDGDFCFE